MVKYLIGFVLLRILAILFGFWGLVAFMASAAGSGLSPWGGVAWIVAALALYKLSRITLGTGVNIYMKDKDDE
jgi:hypothetical protein